MGPGRCPMCKGKTSVEEISKTVCGSYARLEAKAWATSRTLRGPRLWKSERKVSEAGLRKAARRHIKPSENLPSLPWTFFGSFLDWQVVEGRVTCIAVPSSCLRVFLVQGVSMDYWVFAHTHTHIVSLTQWYCRLRMRMFSEVFRTFLTDLSVTGTTVKKREGYWWQTL